MCTKYAIIYIVLDTKLISSGTYGCIYHPGLSCSHDSKKIRDINDRKNKITKTF